MHSGGHTAHALLVPSVTSRNVALRRKALQSSYAPYVDGGKPAGGGATSGVKTGGFGFHTEDEFAPWWMLDLGDVHEIETIRVFNRQDVAAERARTLCVSLAWNAAGPWVEIYKSSGVFGGILTGDPLTIPVDPRIAARFVRLHLSERNMFHLDEVEVYASRASDEFQAGEAELLFPADRATMDYPSEADGPKIWEDMWKEDIAKWALFQSKYAPDLQAFLNPACAQEKPELSAGVTPGFDGWIRTLRLLRYARFANNFYQILNGAMLARAMKCSVLQIPLIDNAPANLPFQVDSIEIQGFSEDPPAGPSISANFYIPNGLESVLGSYDAEFALDTIERFVKPVYQTYLAAVGSLDAQTMAMHFRGGDVFGAWWTVNPDYVQPPASYYIRALEYGIRRLGITAVHLVYEDKKNPAVDIVIEHLQTIGITFSEQSASLFTDVVSLMSAHHLVAANGTFCEAIALLSPVTRSYFAFRRISSQRRLSNFWAQSRVADMLHARGLQVFSIDDPDQSYIGAGSWGNSPEQLDMIRSYPTRKLRLMSLSGEVP